MFRYWYLSILSIYPYYSNYHVPFILEWNMIAWFPPDVGVSKLLEYDTSYCCEATWASGSDCFHESDVLVEFEPIDGASKPETRSNRFPLAFCLTVFQQSQHILRLLWEAYLSWLHLFCWRVTLIKVMVTCWCLSAFGLWNLGGEKKFYHFFSLKVACLLLLNYYRRPFFLFRIVFFSWALFIR